MGALLSKNASLYLFHSIAIIWKDVMLCSLVSLQSFYISSIRLRKCLNISFHYKTRKLVFFAKDASFNFSLLFLSYKIKEKLCCRSGYTLRRCEILQILLLIFPVE